MLDQANNQLLTQVGLGTPMGNLLRRYWMPVAAVSVNCVEAVIGLVLRDEIEALLLVMSTVVPPTATTFGE